MNHTGTNTASSLHTHGLTRRRGLWAAATILGLGLVAIGEARARAADACPFEVLVSGTVAVASDSIHFHLAGTGTSSLLGATTYSADGEILSEDAANGDFTDILNETLTDANGDTLSIQCKQSARALGNGVYQGTDQWTVTGGTGRFRGAIGSGSGDTSINLERSTFAKYMNGTVAY